MLNFERLWLKILLIIAVFLGFQLFTAAKIEALIEINTDRDYVVSQTGEMRVTETETITNGFKDRFLPRGSERQYSFVISAQTTEERKQVAESIYAGFSLTIAGKPISYTKYKEGEEYGIKYLLPQSINPGKSQTLKVSYTHPELAEKNGGILDAYIPAFADDFVFNQENSVSNYRTKLFLPVEAGPDNVISIAPTRQYTDGSYDVYEFSQTSMVGKFVWVQKGSQQIYKFTLTQPLPATTNNNNGNIDEYQVVIPRDVEELNISQTVYFTKVSPAPLAINVDQEGNLIAIYRKNSFENTEVKVEGYAVVKSQRQDFTEAGSIDDVSAALGDATRYLQPADFWEVNSPQISEFATQSLTGETAIYPAVNKLYETVVDRIDYSQVKRFGLNERQGALQTLNGGAAVCMEYADLYLTLLRNRGIPARAAFGYGYDSRLPASKQEPHQWVQVYLPKQQKWIGVDVTWGESGNKVIGGDLNHFYTHLAARDPNNPPVLSRLSILGTDTSLAEPTYEIVAVDNLPQTSLLTTAQLQEQYPAQYNSEETYYLALLQQKYTSSFRNLFTDPGQIDIQGWFLLGFTTLFLIVMGAVLLRIAKMAFNVVRGQSKKPQIKPLIKL